MSKARAPETFTDLPALAQHLRTDLENKKVILLFAHKSLLNNNIYTCD